MDFDMNKILILFGVIILTGVGVNLLPKFMGRNTSVAMLENALDFNLDARRACVSSVRDKTKKQIDEPSSTDGNGKTKVVFTWNSADSTYNKITCTYEGGGKGVTSIILDGNPVAL